MRAPQVVFQTLQEPQPFTNSERDLADHDVEYLIEFMQFGGESFSVDPHPERRDPTSPAPDYLMRAADTESVVTVEHSVLREEELQNEKSRRERHDESFRPPWRSLAPAQIGELLGALIRRRIERSKLLDVNADGYVLLFRNRLDANLDAFTEVSILPDQSTTYTLSSGANSSSYERMSDRSEVVPVPSASCGTSQCQSGPQAGPREEG